MNAQIKTIKFDDWNKPCPEGYCADLSWVAICKSTIPPGLIDKITPIFFSQPTDACKLYFSTATFIDGPYQVPILNKEFLPEIVFLRNTSINDIGSIKTWDDLIDGSLEIKFPIAEAYEMLCQFSDYYVQAGCLITDYCNLSCKMCMFHSKDDEYDFNSLRNVKRGKQKISEKIMLSFLDQIPENRRILFSASGEIFTCKNEVLKYLDYAKKDINLDVSFISNAGLLDKEIAKKITEIGVSNVIFSVDGHFEAAYNEIRKGGDFKETISNIKKYIKINRASKTPANIAINTILFEMFESQKDDILNFWRAVGVDRHNFLVERVNYLGKPRTLFTCLDQKLKNYCFDPLQGPILLVSGRIAPCCSVAIGEYFEPMDWLCSIEEVSLANAIRQYREMLLDDKSELKKYCKRCHYWSANYTYDNKNPFSATTEFNREPPRINFLRRFWK